jgi:hypothetical protein
LLVNQRIPHKKVLDIFKKYKKKAHINVGPFIKLFK